MTLLNGMLDSCNGAGQFRVCNSIWLLDDFTAEIGPTRVVPGSHPRGTLPKDAMRDPAAPHPNEVTLLAPAGTVVIFNSHLWHGGTLNRTAAPSQDDATTVAGAS